MHYVPAQYSAFGCANDVITLSCPDERTIVVNTAVYGQHQSLCNISCCPPHPTDDCQEDVSDIRESDWIALKITCDNQTTCDYQYMGALISECAFEYTADYMRIFYACLPGKLRI